MLLFGMAALPVSAEEAGWDFSDEYPDAEPTGVTINVYNWGEYIANGTEGSLDINAEFTRRTGIEVNYTTFDSNESLYSKLAGGGANYDVIILRLHDLEDDRGGHAGGARFFEHPEFPVHR